MTWDGGSVLYAAARWLYYLAAFLVIGALVFRAVVWPRAARGTGSAQWDGLTALPRLAAAAALVLLLALGGRLYWQTRSLLEPGEPITAEFVHLVLASEWGAGWVKQSAAGAVALVGWVVISALDTRPLGTRRPAGSAEPARARLDPVGTTGLVIAGLGTLGLVLAAPLTGHAIALPRAGRAGYWLDALHFLMGGAWLGGLAAIGWIALRPRRPAGPAQAIVGAFSPVALTAGLGAITAGLIIGYRYLGGLAPLVTTGYGLALVIKVLLVAGVAGLGAYNWRRVLPRLRTSGELRPVRRTAWAELGIGVVLLAVTAVLVALSAPGEE